MIFEQNVLRPKGTRSLNIDLAEFLGTFFGSSSVMSQRVAGFSIGDATYCFASAVFPGTEMSHRQKRLKIACAAADLKHRETLRHKRIEQRVRYI